MFAFADTHQDLAIDEEAMRKLLKALYVSAKGLGAPAAVMLSVSKMKRDSAGRIPLSEFNRFCSGAPSMLFPVARLQVRVSLQTFNRCVLILKGDLRCCVWFGVAARNVPPCAWRSVLARQEDEVCGAADVGKARA